MLQQQVEGCEALQDADLCVQCLVLRMQGFADAHQVLCIALSYLLVNRKACNTLLAG